MKTSTFHLQCMVFFLAVGSGCASIRPVPVEPFADGRDWVLLKDLKYRIGNTQEVIVVPAGFVTDFASVPRSFWAVYSPVGQYQWAAVVHDYLYWTQQCTRDQADQLMRLAMAENRVPALTREAIFRSVQVGGEGAWNDNAAAKASGKVRFIPLKMTPDGRAPLVPIEVDDDWAKYREKLEKSGMAVPPNEATPSGNRPSYCTIVEAELRAMGL
ncbi:DUF1353 domain-containing protein [Archangium lipolyticum]|uniref:DUF1353 domain-containing protein n=1 Tax=Archangium lipolyticum TaxID=2970465 RepID=UPI00214C9483|nr:DUF1353 domain-containing protein [Archangium lipolyticum]